MLSGIKATLLKLAPAVKVSYVKGCDRMGTGPTAKNGFRQALTAAGEQNLAESLPQYLSSQLLHFVRLSYRYSFRNFLPSPFLS